MPSGVHEEEINLPIESIWAFVKDMNNWAPLVPGYIEHEIINEKQSTWKFKGDLGFMKKLIHLRIDITEWVEPTSVSFDLTGINENFSGKGYFKAVTLNENKTKMIGCLDISAGGGGMAIMVNSILKTFVPTTTTELTTAIAAKIKEIHGLEIS